MKRNVLTRPEVPEDPTVPDEANGEGEEGTVEGDV